MRYFARRLATALAISLILFGVRQTLYNHGGHSYRSGYARSSEGGGRSLPPNVNTGVTASRSNCDAQLAGGEAPRLLDGRGGGAIELCYTGFDVLYSPVSRTPIWSAEHLTAARVEAALRVQRVDAFHVDPSLPSRMASTLEDYARSGYDRGHMSPSGDMATAQAQYESFTLANMIPQNSNNNRILWEGVESATRQLAEQTGDLYVVTGPIFSANPDSIRGGVEVPSRIFKAVYDPRDGAAAAYITNNAAGMEWAGVSIAELEELTGIDPFPAAEGAEARILRLSAPHPHSSGR